MRALAFAVAALGLSSLYSAEIHVVDTSDNTKFQTIQAAIDAALDDDEIVVAPETYVEFLDLKGKAITLRSSAGADTTIIDVTTHQDINDGSKDRSVIKCTTGEGPETVIDGFTIRGGKGSEGVFGSNAGGGMLNEGASPTVRNCVFEANEAGDGCGMANQSGSSPKVYDCEFRGNTGGSGGGIINYVNSSPTVVRCLFESNEVSNTGGGIYNREGSNPKIANCIFLNNSATYTGGGLFMGVQSNCEVVNCLFVGNSAGTDGGAVFVHGNSNPTIVNCTLYDNTASGNGDGLHNSAIIDGCTVTLINSIVWANGDGGGDVLSAQVYTASGSTTTISYCCIQGLTDTSNGNIGQDPLFEAATSGNFRLSEDSPCIDAGDTDSLPSDWGDLDDDGDTEEQIPLDLDGAPRVCGEAVDMGAFEYQIVQALIDVDPDTLNKKSNGKWVTAYITLPEGLDVQDIDVATIAITALVGDSCPADYSQPIDVTFTPEIGDRDEDLILDLTVKFDRQVLLPNLCLDDVAITIEGQLTTGETFSGTDQIRVIDRGK